MQLCEMVRDQLVKSVPLSPALSRSGEKSHTHPRLEDRILAIRLELLDKTADDQRAAVKQFVDGYDRFATGLTMLVSESIELALKDRSLEQNAPL